MKTPFLLLAVYICLMNGRATAQTINETVSLIGYFDGRTPCQELARLLQEPTIPECIKIKWRLSLYKSGADSAAGTFRLEGFKFRGDHILKGTWRLTTGTSADPNALVYLLELPAHPIQYLLKAGPEVLLFLDANKNILVGNRNFSYALYKAAKE